MKSGMAHCQLGCVTRYDPKKPTAIGSFDPNPFGFHNITGSVAVWVEDCWHKDYTNASINQRKSLGQWRLRISCCKRWFLF